MSLLVQVGQVSAADVTTKARDIDPLIASGCLFLFILIFFLFGSHLAFTSSPLFSAQFRIIFSWLVTPFEWSLKYSAFTWVLLGDLIPQILLCLGLQFLREKPQEIASPESKLSLPKRSVEELGGADPDVQLCYQIEATFMDIISSSTQALWHHRFKYGQISLRTLVTCTLESTEHYDDWSLATVASWE